MERCQEEILYLLREVVGRAEVGILPILPLNKVCSIVSREADRSVLL